MWENQKENGKQIIEKNDINTYHLQNNLPYRNI